MRVASIRYISQSRTKWTVIARGAGNGGNVTDIKVLPHWRKISSFVRSFKNDYSTHHDIHIGSNAEDKDAVQVGHQVSLCRENGEKETGKDEAGKIGNHN